MSDKEQKGFRDLTYSRWHRPENVKRFMPHKDAWSLGLIDIDGCEYCRWCSSPIALTEVQESEKNPKSATVTEKLARKAGIPAYSVSYATDGSGDIKVFLVQQISPRKSGVRKMLPKVYAYFLLSLRQDHWRDECEALKKG